MSLVSIVIPVYYNAASLAALLERLQALAGRQKAHAFEFIFVDDGSGDDSYAIMRQLAQHDERVRLLKLARNFGSNMAILAGMTHAHGDCVAFVAADLQDPPEALDEMIAQWQAGSKVSLAVRRDRRGDPFFTRLAANFFNFLFAKLVYSGFSPQGVGFFLVDRQVAQVVIACREKNAHLIGLILWSGFKFTQVVYDRVERLHGRSRWTFGKKLKYFIDAFVAFSFLPLRLATTLGLLFAGLGGIYALIVIWLRLANATPVQGWTALMVVVLVLAGIQLILLGVIGEYLWRSFDAVRQRPLFIVEEIVEKRDGG